MTDVLRSENGGKLILKRLHLKQGAEFYSDLMA